MTEPVFLLHKDIEGKLKPDLLADKARTDHRINNGLRFEKYFGQWMRGDFNLRDEGRVGKRQCDKKTKLQLWETEPGTVDPLKNWLRPRYAAEEACAGKPVSLVVGDMRLVDESVARQRKLAEAAGQQVFRCLTLGKLATGLGRGHPIENGFTWHPLLGAPYLPASGLKQVAYSAAELGRSELDEVGQAKSKADCTRIFGSRDPKKHSAGSVVFLDGLPVARITVQADVLTPHYRPYYEHDASKWDRGDPPTLGDYDGPAPGDWTSPTPISFLVVATGQPFQFAVLPRRAKSAGDAADACRARSWLIAGLSILGAGAKTSGGYGRFTGPV